MNRQAGRLDLVSLSNYHSLTDHDLIKHEPAPFRKNGSHFLAIRNKCQVVEFILQIPGY